MNKSSASRGVALFAALFLASSLNAQGTRADWPSYGGNLNAWRFSELDQINTENVRKLAPVWAFQTGDYEQGLQSTPIVVDGVMYVSTSSNRIFALNAATGELIWRYAYESAEPRAYGRQNRGVALGHGLVFMGTADNRVVAVDQKTGREVWRVTVQDPKQCGCNITAAPLLVKDLVVVGGTGGDSAHRGSLTAFDAKTGRFRWRFYVIPAPGEPGSETWSGDAWKYGGGAPWMTGSYDPELDLVFWGTGNAAADLDGASRPGDNLYTASVIALEADTGKLRWHYQEVPHDVWDYDSTYECVLADLPVNGEMRKLLLHPTKTGYTWVLDRTNGKFVGAWKMIDGINWVSGMTEDGKLVGRREPTRENSVDVCPSATGAKSWNQSAYSPESGLLYVPVMRFCNELFAREQTVEPGALHHGGFWRMRKQDGATDFSGIAAFDPVTGEKKWEHGYKYVLLASVLATRGGLVFSGNAEGEFFALDARNGRRLWSFQTGSGHRGSSVAYAVNGRHFVATPSGWGSLAGPMLSLFPDYPEASSPRSGSTIFAFALQEGN